MNDTHAAAGLPPAPPGHWLARNARWLVPAVVVVLLSMVLLSCAGLVLMVMHMMRTSPPHQMAMPLVFENDRVVQALGTPIEQGALVQGSFSTSGDTGSADLQVPIAGPNGDAVVHIKASKAAGTWTLDHVTVQFESDARKLIIVPAPDPATEPATEPAP